MLLPTLNKIYPNKRAHRFGGQLLLAALVAIFLVHPAVYAEQDYESSLKPGTLDLRTDPPPVVPKISGPAWNNDLLLALRKAKHKHKLVLVDIYTDWCGWCHRLDKDTYSSPAVIEYLKQFVLLKLNAEDGGEGEAFAKKHHLGAYPCIAVLDYNGNMKGKIYGFRLPEEFPSSIDAILPKNLSKDTPAATSLMSHP